MGRSKKNQTATTQHSPELIALVKLLARAAVESDHKASGEARDQSSHEHLQNGEESQANIAIYARYSTDMQSQASIEDQVLLCTQRAEREGWTIWRLWRSVCAWAGSPDAS